MGNFLKREKMKRILLAIVFIALFVFSNPSSISFAEESSTNANQSIGKIDLPEISKERVEELKKEIVKDKQKPVKQIEINSINNMLDIDPFTSISSQGDYVIPTKKFTSNNSPLETTFDTNLILPTENRVRVTNTTVSPYNAIAQIDFYDATTGQG